MKSVFKSSNTAAMLCSTIHVSFVMSYIIRKHVFGSFRTSKTQTGLYTYREQLRIVLNFSYCKKGHRIWAYGK